MIKLSKRVRIVFYVIIGLEAYAIAALRMSDIKGVWFSCLVTAAVLTLTALFFWDIGRGVLAGVWGVVGVIVIAIIITWLNSLIGG